MKTTVGQLKQVVAHVIAETKSKKSRCAACGSNNLEHIKKAEGKSTGGTYKCKDCGNKGRAIKEAARMLPNPQEVLTTYEDLYLNSHHSKRKGEPQMQPGVVTLEDLASWMGVTPEAVKQVMPKVGLIVDKNGNVVERGMTPPPGALHAVKP